MMLALLPLAAQAASAGETPERVSQPALLEAFRSFCLGGASVGAIPDSAVTDGFHPVPVTPPSPGWREVGAWQRGGLRLFTLDQTESRALPICGVSANIGQLVEDDMLIDPVGRMADSVFVESNPGRRRSGWMIVGRQRFVRVSIDRPDEADVTVILLADPPRRQEEAAP